MFRDFWATLEKMDAEVRGVDVDQYGKFKLICPFIINLVEVVHSIMTMFDVITDEDHAVGCHK